jgi:hypothetical protein
MLARRRRSIFSRDAYGGSSVNRNEHTLSEAVALSPGGVIRSGDYKLLEFFEDGRPELYNVVTDIGGAAQSRLDRAGASKGASREAHRMAEVRRRKDAGEKRLAITWHGFLTRGLAYSARHRAVLRSNQTERSESDLFGEKKNRG